MGCNYYSVSGWDDETEKWKEGSIKFNDLDDSLHCLCGFRTDSEYALSPEQVRSLAYLGAAVALQHEKYEDFRSLPGSLPENIREEIDRIILKRSNAALGKE